MKPINLLLALLLAPALSFCQTVINPAVGSTEDPTTTITKIEVTDKNTVITFKHVAATKGAWMQLNKSIYLQDANGEERYSYVRSEGIPLRPEKHYAAADNEALIFKVYFEKLKPGTTEINVIERARSAEELASGYTYDNFYKVSLQKQAPIRYKKIDTASVSNVTNHTPGMNDVMSTIPSMMENVYSGMLAAQLKTYAAPTVVDQISKITRNYYQALIKAGFTADEALKIILSKPLISSDSVVK